MPPPTAPLLRSAQALLDSAMRERDYNPEAAYVLAYDAARKAATGLLAHQGLRPKSTGHHVTVETAVRAPLIAARARAEREGRQLIQGNNADRAIFGEYLGLQELTTRHVGQILRICDSSAPDT